MEIIKNENLIDIAYQASDYERENSIYLNTGVSDNGNTWEIIVKYADDIDYLSEKYNDTKVVTLINNYGVIITKRDFVESIIGESSIIYAEMPKNYYFGMDNYKAAACINNIYNNTQEGLYGRGVLVAVLDSGIDIYSDEFTYGDKTSRIVSLWDQTIDYDEEYYNIYELGRIWDNDDINRAIYDGYDISADYNGHGTYVTQILAGRTNGVASASEIVAIKLSDTMTYTKTTRIMYGVDYAIRYATLAHKPLVINISLGNNYGSHRGNSVFERFLSDASLSYRVGIFVGAGNEGERNIHSSGIIKPSGDSYVYYTIGQYESRLSLDIWKKYIDDYNVYIHLPSGERRGPINMLNNLLRFRYNDMEIMTYYGMPSALEPSEEIYVEYVPYNSYLVSGEYAIVFSPVNIRDGRYDIWMPSSKILNRNTRFETGDVYGTITVPATAKGVISVGAYNSMFDTYATFSGRGLLDSYIKPDIVAPGVDIYVKNDGISDMYVSGTSYATPIVAGCGALLMEWGIVRGNNIFMYGELLKEVLKRGAVNLREFNVTPNETVGAGAICLSESFRYL